MSYSKKLEACQFSKNGFKHSERCKSMNYSDYFAHELYIFNVKSVFSDKQFCKNCQAFYFFCFMTDNVFVYLMNGDIHTPDCRI